MTPLESMASVDVIAERDDGVVGLGIDGVDQGGESG